ncbi:hypothetical protein CyaNS01_01577 [Cyanobium sp. NS01]|nr:hypothetical protein CyaNS01_01577 [Cyanobium sp. NS01]
MAAEPGTGTLGDGQKPAAGRSAARVEAITDGPRRPTLALAQRPASLRPLLLEVPGGRLPHP